MIIDGTNIRKSLDMQSNILSICICIIENSNCPMDIIDEFVKCIKDYVTCCDMDCIDTSVSMMVSYTYHYVILDRLTFEQAHTLDAFITTAALKEAEKISDVSSAETDRSNDAVWQIFRHHLIPRYKTKHHLTTESISKTKRIR